MNETLARPRVAAKLPSVRPASATVTSAEAGAMLRAVFRLFEKWRVTDAEARILLGQPSASTLYRWKRGEIGAIPSDTVWRLADLMGIHKALRFLFADVERGYAWVRKPNLAFAGRSALERMLAGAPADLTGVRAYLDADRSGW